MCAAGECWTGQAACFVDSDQSTAKEQLAEHSVCNIQPVASLLAVKYYMLTLRAGVGCNPGHPAQAGVRLRGGSVQDEPRQRLDRALHQVWPCTS